MDTPNHHSRRVSIFWPLVLVALGVLWLLNNFGVIAGANFFVLFRLWPILLIAAGLDLLVGRRWPVFSVLIAVVTVGVAVAAVILAPQLGLAQGGVPWGMSAPWLMFSGERGSGNVVTESRDVSGFDSVEFSTFGDLTIQQGETESLSIEGEDNFLPLIKTEVRSGRLYIGYPAQFGSGVSPTEPVRFTLTVKNLKELSQSGAGNILVQGLKTDALEVSISGAGNCEITDFDGKSLDFQMSGAGQFTASGEAESVKVSLSGFGNLNAGDLKSQSVEVDVSGAGNATVWATESLDVHLSGAGSVGYYGDPKVTEDMSGVGSVHHISGK